MRDLRAIVLLTCWLSGCLRKYDDFEVGPTSTGVNTSQTRADAAAPDLTHSAPESTAASDVSTTTETDVDDTTRDDERDNAAFDAATGAEPAASSVTSTGTEEVSPQASTSDAGSERPWSETENNSSVVVPTPNDAGAEHDAATDGGKQETPVLCGNCNPLREVCDTDCSRSEEQCLLDCTGNPGKCRRDCGDARRSCALACLNDCDECYLSEGCVAVCAE